MFKKIYSIIICFLILTFIGCNTQTPEFILQSMDYFKNPLEKYKPERLKIPQRLLNVENFIILLDVSESMNEPYAGETKLSHAKKILTGLKNTLPDNLQINFAVRTFNECYCTRGNQTDLIHGLSDYSEDSFKTFLDTAEAFAKKCPLALALDATADDLKTSFGNTAVIVISDGKIYDNSAFYAAARLKSLYGTRLCVHTILLGNEPSGKRFLNNLTTIGKCGISKRADCLAGNQCMQDFVKAVFLSKKVITTKKSNIDTDGDGVYDYLDQCPDTIKNIKVDVKGCPFDRDNDGVFDYIDQCPNTLPGTTVDNIGCALKDADGDGVDDSKDQCPGTKSGKIVDKRGCVLSDNDNDGVPDDKDQCIGTPRGADVNESGCWVINNLEFDNNKWDVKQKFNYKLDKIIKILNDNSTLKIEIQGHTDDIGNQEYNKSLSGMRASSIMRYLIRKGVRPERVSATGYGYLRPITLSKTPEGRAKNRRVEIRPIY